MAKLVKSYVFKTATGQDLLAALDKTIDEKFNEVEVEVEDPDVIESIEIRMSVAEQKSFLQDCYKVARKKNQDKIKKIIKKYNTPKSFVDTYVQKILDKIIANTEIVDKI